LTQGYYFSNKIERNADGRYIYHYTTKGTAGDHIHEQKNKKNAKNLLEAEVMDGRIASLRPPSTPGK
jgi:hypothetical protein